MIDVYSCYTSFSIPKFSQITLLSLQHLQDYWVSLNFEFNNISSFFLQFQQEDVYQGTGSLSLLSVINRNRF